MRTSHILAIALAIGAILWVASGQFGGEPAAPAAGEAAVDEPVEAAKVRVAPSQSQPYTVTLTVTGRTAASRELALRTETAGRIETIAVTEGDYVGEDDLLVQLATDDRNQRLSRAQALVEQRQIQADASAELAESGWRAETTDAGARADLQSARAELAAIQLDIARTKISAPFPGALESLDVEIGDVVDVNTQIGKLYDLDPILVIGGDGLLEAANPALTRALGWGIDALLGTAIDDLCHVEDGFVSLARRMRPGQPGHLVDLEVDDVHGGRHRAQMHLAAMEAGSGEHRWVATLRLQPGSPRAVAS